MDEYLSESTYQFYLSESTYQITIHILIVPVLYHCPTIIDIASMYVALYSFSCNFVHQLAWYTKV